MTKATDGVGPLLHQLDYQGLEELRADLGATLNRRWLLFANALAAGQSQVDAYVSAGYKAKTQKQRYTGASRLARKAEIVKYLAIVREMASRGSNVTLTAIIASLTELARDSRLIGEYGVARQCWMDLAKLLGLLPEQRVRLDLVEEEEELDAMPPREILEQLSELVHGSTPADADAATSRATRTLN